MDSLPLTWSRVTVRLLAKAAFQTPFRSQSPERVAIGRAEDARFANRRRTLRKHGAWRDYQRFFEPLV